MFSCILVIITFRRKGELNTQSRSICSSFVQFSLLHNLSEEGFQNSAFNMQICYKSLLCPQPSLLIMSKSSSDIILHIQESVEELLFSYCFHCAFKLDQEKYKLPRRLDNSQRTYGIFKLHATILPHSFSHILTGTYIRHFCCATIESRHPLFYFTSFYGMALIQLVYASVIRCINELFKLFFQSFFLVV